MCCQAAAIASSKESQPCHSQTGDEELRPRVVRRSNEELRTRLVRHNHTSLEISDDCSMISMILIFVDLSNFLSELFCYYY